MNEPHNCTQYFFIWRKSPQWARVSSFTRFLEYTQRCSTVGRTPLDEWSARRRDLPDYTQHSTTDRHPCPRWDSNPKSQQMGGRRPAPSARPLGPAHPI